MAREQDVALLITASGSLVAKHKLQHIKEKDLRTQDFKSEDPFLRDHYGFKTKIQKSESIQGEDFFLEINTFLSQKLRNQNKFAHKEISAHTHTAKN